MGSYLLTCSERIQNMGNWKKVLFKLNIFAKLTSKRKEHLETFLEKKENKVADGVEDDMMIDLSSSPPVPVKTGSGNANIVRQESTFSNRSWCEDDSCAVDNSNHAWDMQSTCDGPQDLSSYKKWKVGGMFDFESTNEKGWKKTNWPPK